MRDLKMKNDFERFHEIIADSKMEIAEKYGRMVAHLEKIEKELRQMINLKINGIFILNQDQRNILKEILGE